MRYMLLIYTREDEMARSSREEMEKVKAGPLGGHERCQRSRHFGRRRAAQGHEHGNNDPP